MALTSEEALSQHRNTIDSIDEQILSLVSQRAEAAKCIAEIKMQHEGDGAVIYRPEREAQVFRRLIEKHDGSLSDEQVTSVFREIMSACRAQEAVLSIAYLGPEGTYTQAAVQAQFGRSVNSIGCAGIDDVFREVSAGTCQYGVVPVENSSEGMVSHTLDTLKASSLKICGEVELPIHHNFLLAANTPVDRITRVYAHPQALAQCRGWLDTHFPSIERVGIASNAEAAKRIRSEWNAAAIAGEVAAELYGLSVHAKNIEDQPDNTTRFLVISQQEIGASGDDKTSVVVTVHNKPGALFELLRHFKSAGVDMTRIESRPSKSEKWDYVFFIDFLGHQTEPHVQELLDAIGQTSRELKSFGSYPRLGQRGNAG